MTALEGLIFTFSTVGVTFSEAFKLDFSGERPAETLSPHCTPFENALSLELGVRGEMWHPRGVSRRRACREAKQSSGVQRYRPRQGDYG
jgi:hypothetical protein